MEKKHYEVGYRYDYDGMRTVSVHVYGTEEQAMLYIIKHLSTEPEWLRVQIDTNFDSKKLYGVFIKPVVVVNL